MHAQQLQASRCTIARKRYVGTVPGAGCRSYTQFISHASSIGGRAGRSHSSMSLLIASQCAIHCDPSKHTSECRLEHVYLRGSHVRFVVLPDILKNAPLFK